MSKSNGAATRVRAQLVKSTPLDVDRDKLLVAFEKRLKVEGEVIKHTEIGKVIGRRYGTPRYHAVLYAWMRYVRQRQGINLSGRVKGAAGIGVMVLGARQSVDLSIGQLQRLCKGVRTPSEYLVNASGGDTQTERRRQSALAVAGQLLATTQVQIPKLGALVLRKPKQFAPVKQAGSAVRKLLK